MEKSDISNREDIAKLIQSFYAKVRQHPKLGPIFNNAIDDWDEHLEKLVGFWETNLLFVQTYKGNPIQAHIEADEDANNQIDQEHFGNWLNLWFETIDEFFQGEKAELAKNRARNMAHVMFIRIWQSRNPQIK
ncbi:MAG: group III truncated hemoglobin [Cyclobacteriaceae bacterium]